MALVNFAGFPPPWIWLPYPRETVIAITTNATIDAAGESQGHLGRIVWPDRGTHTVSSAGGAIIWRSGAANTFANAGTNLRIGLQDLDAAGLEDGTFDVQANLVGGTDAIANDTTFTTPMESGTKSVAHGAEIAVSFELTARAGADSVQISKGTANNVTGTAYTTNDVGAGPAKVNGLPQVVIVADDGAVGWLWGGLIPGSHGSTAIQVGSTPDEYALIFRVLHKTSIVGIGALISAVASTDTYELILYSDPLGTPVAERTITMNPVFLGVGTDTGYAAGLFSSEFLPTLNTDYAVAFRPTSAGPINLFRWVVTSGNTEARKATIWGANASEGTRSDVTGAFTQSLLSLPDVGPVFGSADDGASAGGGGLNVVGGRGGVIQ